MVRKGLIRLLFIVCFAAAMVGMRAQAQGDFGNQGCVDVSATLDAHQAEHITQVASLRGNTLLDGYEGQQSIFAVSYIEQGKQVFSLLRSLIPAEVQEESPLCMFLMGIPSDGNELVPFEPGQPALKVRPPRYDERRARADCGGATDFQAAMWKRRKTNLGGQWTTNQELLALIRKNYAQDQSDPLLHVEEGSQTQEEASGRGNHLCDSLRGMERRIRTVTPKLVGRFHAIMAGGDGIAESTRGIAQLYVSGERETSNHQKWTLLLVFPTGKAVRIAHGDSIIPMNSAQKGN
jgi:hypothetical protein